MLYSDELHFYQHRNKQQRRDVWTLCEDKESHCIECLHMKHRQHKREFYFWCAVGYNYKSPLIFFDGPGSEGPLTEEFYRDCVLGVHVEPRHRVFRAAGHGFVLLESGDFLHRSRSFGDPAWKYKEEMGLHYYSNPPCSFDFNATVGVWRIMQQRLKLPRPVTKEEMQWEIQVEWDKITLEEINKEVTSMEGRIAVCLERGGLQTYT